MPTPEAMQFIFLRELLEAKSEKDWNKICDEVKAHTKNLPIEERSGEYPKWWYPEVIQSGLIGIKSQEFKLNAQR